MTTHSVQLLGPSGAVVATARVADEGGYYAGTADLARTPAGVRALFAELEEVVAGQMFAFLDDVQERIGAAAVAARFDDGAEAAVADVQVFPSTGDVSFRLAGAAAGSA